MANEERKAPGMRGWVKGLLFVSLALNLVIVGIVAGAFFRFGPPPHDRTQRDSAFPYTRALTENDQRALRGKMRDVMRSERRDRATRDASYQQALTLLRADPFDPSAFSAHLEAQFSASAKARDAGRIVLVEHIAGMSTDDRQAYAARLQDALEHRRAHRKPRED